MWVDVADLMVYCDANSVRITGSVVKQSAMIDVKQSKFCLRWNKDLPHATVFITETNHDEFTNGKDVVDFNELANILIGVSNDT